ncbi:aldehyde dehydrogenase family protein [Streptomyces sp. NPDC037389]|uniref:aldehyde dehydrogenase family protein n=1 Tax=Streptomyces sp. NPDC037389 TaxID=3155369 RepID=UPI0034084C22
MYASAQRTASDGHPPASGGWAARCRFRVSRPGASVREVADAVEDRHDRLAAYESYGSGLPIGQARRAAENFRHFAGVITAFGEDAFRQGGAGEEQLSYVIRRPAGVAGLITPWNTPFMLQSWKLAPALAAGCAAVLKPSEWTPLSASLWPEILTSSGVPAGVVNIVHGTGPEAGQSLVDHPGAPLVSFTGSTATGRRILRSCAERLKAASMELGGKSPVVVFADADVEAALDTVVFGAFSLNGERCTAGSRVLVESPLYEEFTRRLADRAARIRVGPSSDPATEVGPLVHADHYRRVLEYTRTGREEARLVVGGRVEIYTSDCCTGDPGHGTYRWNVHDDRRRDFWGNAVIESWYKEASPVHDLGGAVRPVSGGPLEESSARVGADGLG